MAIKTVKIEATGSRVADSIAANKAAGLAATPDGYVWHHVEYSAIMQLVPKDIHGQTGHTGGFSLRKYLSGRYAMSKNIYSHNSATSEAEIKTFEAVWGISLPKAYREFLLQYNGGRPTLTAFPIEGFAEDSIGAVQVFFGLKSKISSDDLNWIYSNLSESVPREILPIACTDGNDYVCIDLRKPKSPVVFWDRRPFWGNEIWNEEYLYPVAADFPTFLLSLKKNPYI